MVFSFGSKFKLLLVERVAKSSFNFFCFWKKSWKFDELGSVVWYSIFRLFTRLFLSWNDFLLFILTGLKE